MDRRGFLMTMGALGLAATTEGCATLARIAMRPHLMRNSGAPPEVRERIDDLSFTYAVLRSDGILPKIAQTRALIEAQDMHRYFVIDGFEGNAYRKQGNLATAYEHLRTGLRNAQRSLAEERAAYAAWLDDERWIPNREGLWVVLDSLGLWHKDAMPPSQRLAGEQASVAIAYLAQASAACPERCTYSNKHAGEVLKLARQRELVIGPAEPRLLPPHMRFPVDLESIIKA